VNKAVIIGIVVSGIIIGTLTVLSLDSFSVLEDDGVSEPILGIEEETKNESKPQGRNFSIELDEKMGFTAP